VYQTPELVANAWSYFKDVQNKERQYTPLIRPTDVPAIWMNEQTMEELFFLINGCHPVLFQ